MTVAVEDSDFPINVDTMTLTFHVLEPEEPEYICGDANGDEITDIDDVVFLIQYLFASGPAPDPLASGDVDCSGMIDIDDVVYLIQYLFQSGLIPCDPSGDSIPDC